MANELQLQEVADANQQNEWPAGYFRLGHIVLDIPPTAISTNKIVNDDQVATLRTGTPMFVKTGQSRWDVTVQWKAVRKLNDDGSFDYSQWRKLRDVVAIFKAAPFVEVENQFLRQHFTNIQAAYATQRMGFALRQLRVDTDPNTTNVINVTLTMSLFNYAPFTKDFGYKDLNGNSVSASESSEFRTFITNWQTDNMNAHHKKATSPSIMPWDYQEDGLLTLKWRNYTFIPFSGNVQPPATSRASSNLNPTQPTQTVSKRVKSKKLSDDIVQLINTTAARYGLDPQIVQAQCIVESGGKANAVSRTGAVGLLQLLPSTAQLTATQLKDPATNLDAGCKYLSLQLQKFKDYYHALGAYNVGPGYVYAYSQGKPVKPKHGQVINPRGEKTDNGLPPANIPNGENATVYVETILAIAGRSQDVPATPVKSPDGTVQSTATSTQMVDLHNPDYVKLLQEAIAQLPDNGSDWFLDHYTNLGAFFYQENQKTFASGDSPIDGDFDMYPDQISVVMVNNIPLIPLAGMQYPTYQHVGPTDTMISVSFNSVGDNDTSLSEPEHAGIESIAAMISQMESQFHSLRSSFRAVSSIHRMQAIFMENRLLNMLGIEGTMVRGFTTETVPDSQNLVQANLLVSQYENIFEETGPFQINGLQSVNKTALANIMKSGELNNLSREEQNSINVVKEFANAWKNQDTQYFIAQIFKITGEQVDPLSSIQAPAANLRPDQKNVLLSYLDLSATGTNAAPGFFGAAKQILIPNQILGEQGGLKFQKDVYPGLQIRRNSLAPASGTMSYADFLVFSSLPIVSDNTMNASLKQQVETAIAPQKKNAIDLMYQSLFDWLCLTNPIFSRQSQLITTSPNFRDRFNNNVSVDGPATQIDKATGKEINPNRGCYKDLGLRNYSDQPGGYFVDYNDIINKSTDELITQTMGVANQTAGTINQTQGPKGPTNAPGTVTFVGADQGLPGNANALIRMKNLPSYGMNQAFPTFKLLLIEEDNTGPFFAFDNFYSYSSIIDIEVIKYRDKPDTAVIQLSNLAHLLTHRLYDDTAAGKMERKADQFNASQNGSLVLGGPAVQAGEVGTGGPSDKSGILAGKTANGTPYQQWMAKDLTEGPTSAFSRVPLKFFALQTGSKIQVRMGYSNNPDALFPVFTGQITQIDGDEILTITCQSFMLELMSQPGTTVQANSRFGFNFLSGGAAFGGWSLSSSGDALNVMKTMLKSPVARHFGHWQINGVADPKIKGFEWTALIGEAMENADNKTISKIGGLLQTGYDRSGENILTNSVVNIDASKTADSTTANGVRMSFQQENPNLVLGSARYGIDKQSKRSIWDILKDISRRYPAFNLMVKDYGFPYGADATLVYGHPLDWYYCRPALLGDAEREKADNAAHAQQFNQWWQSVGADKWDQIWQESFDKMSVWVSVFGVSIKQNLEAAQPDLTRIAGSSSQGFSTAVTQIHGILTGSTDIPPSTSGVDTFFNAIQGIQNVFAKVQTSGNLTANFFKNMDAQFQALYREWVAFLAQADPAANSSRLKPVRKYHLIDYNHIVHNGISVDDQVYNCVKIDNLKPFKFNQNVPDHHTRMLDVTDQIEDISNNVKQGWSDPLANSYAQSFLKEEVGKMYRGDLILRGVPDIEPFDVILLNDISTGMIGPIEVDTVIHSFNLENGYITIIKPRCLVLANEAVSTNIIQNLSLAWAHASANLHDLGTVFNPFSLQTTTSARIVETGISAGALLGAAATLAWIPYAGIVLASLALIAGAGILVFAGGRETKNFFKLMPLSRYGRPWVGGIQGFAIGDFAYSLGQSFKWFDAEEIAPTIESWHELMHYQADYLPPGQ